MNDNILTKDQWSELWEAVNFFDQNGDRTALNRVLVSIMTSTVESLDDDDVQIHEDDDIEKQFVITLIERELADMIAVNTCESWCCQRRRVHPLNQNGHKFSTYLINIARAKSFDKDDSGFISKEIIQRIFTEQVTNGQMNELLHFAETNDGGNINYRDFATMVLTVR